MSKLPEAINPAQSFPFHRFNSKVSSYLTTEISPIRTDLIEIDGTTKNQRYRKPCAILSAEPTFISTELDTRSIKLGRVVVIALNRSLMFVWVKLANKFGF